MGWGVSVFIKENQRVTGKYIDCDGDYRKPLVMIMHRAIHSHTDTHTNAHTHEWMPV